MGQIRAVLPKEKRWHNTDIKKKGQETDRSRLTQPMPGCDFLEPQTVKNDSVKTIATLLMLQAGPIVTHRHPLEEALGNIEERPTATNYNDNGSSNQRGPITANITANLRRGPPASPVLGPLQH